MNYISVKIDDSFKDNPKLSSLTYLLPDGFGREKWEEQINKDLNRGYNFRIEDKIKGKTYFIEDGETDSGEKIENYDSMKDFLTKLGLNQQQAEHIALTSHQSSMGGNMAAFAPWLFEEGRHALHRNGLFMELIIEKDGSVKFRGGRKYLFFDPTLSGYLGADENFAVGFLEDILDENHKKDYIGNFAETDLGKIGEGKGEIFSTIIRLEGSGAAFQKLSEDLKSVKTAPNISGKERYSEFSKNLWGSPEERIAKRFAKTLEMVAKKASPENLSEELKKAVADFSANLRKVHFSLNAGKKEIGGDRKKQKAATEFKGFSEPKFLKGFVKKSDREIEKFAEKITSYYMGKEPKKSSDKNFVRVLLKSIKKFFLGKGILSESLKNAIKALPRPEGKVYREKTMAEKILSERKNSADFKRLR